MVKNISIIGSTGSIGRQTLEVVDYLKDIKVWGLSANTNIEMLEYQIRKYKPAVAAVIREDLAHDLRQRVRDIDTRIVVGPEGMVETAIVPQAEMVVTSVVGIAGLMPTIHAIKNGKYIALANKETLVTAGSLVMKLAQEYNVPIIPVDSEHSAIFQCLQGNNYHAFERNKYLRRIILTASGGPFVGRKPDELLNITPAQALKHPKWDMGNKISIDSATMMNKGLEVIEAKWLYHVDTEQIEVLIHPQSIIHSMVEFIDNAVIAQLGVPDMKIPIQYALTYPERTHSDTEVLNLLVNNSLTFIQPDYKTFKSLGLAYRACREGGTMPAVLNAANEVAVELFLNEKISFQEIPLLVEEVMNRHSNIPNVTLKDILEKDQWARRIIIDDLVK